MLDRFYLRIRAEAHRKEKSREVIFHDRSEVSPKIRGWRQHFFESGGNENPVFRNHGVKRSDLVSHEHHNGRRNRNQRENPSPVLPFHSQKKHTGENERKGDRFLLGLPGNPSGQSD